MPPRFSLSANLIYVYKIKRLWLSIIKTKWSDNNTAEATLLSNDWITKTGSDSIDTLFGWFHMHAIFYYYHKVLSNELCKIREPLNRRHDIVVCIWSHCKTNPDIWKTIIITYDEINKYQTFMRHTTYAQTCAYYFSSFYFIQSE